MEKALYGSRIFGRNAERLFSGFEYGNAPDIERYIQADPENAEYEYWLSIRNEKK